MPEFLEVLKNRRSIRRYKPQAISKDTILELLDLCRCTPNAHNAQPFRFVVIHNKNIRKKLITAMGSIFEADLKQDGVAESQIKKAIETSYNRFLNAPVLILVCLTMDDMQHYSDPERQQHEFIMGVQSVANAVQNLLLLAQSEGLGACWYCAPLFCPDTIKTILHLPPSYIPQAFITLGIPDETPPPIKHKPLAELIHFLE